MFFEYADNKKAYKLLDLESRVVFYSRDVRFYENIFPFKLKIANNDNISKNAELFVKSFPFHDDPQLGVYDENRFASDGSDLETFSRTATELFSSDVPCETATDHDNTSSDEACVPLFDPMSITRPCISETEPLRRLSKQIKLRTKLNDFQVSINSSKVKYPLTSWSFMTTLSKHVEPKSVSEVLQNLAWKQSMDLEMKALLDNETWTISNLPSGRKPIGCK